MDYNQLPPMTNVLLYPILDINAMEGHTAFGRMVPIHNAWEEYSMLGNCDLGGKAFMAKHMSDTSL